MRSFAMGLLAVVLLGTAARVVARDTVAWPDTPTARLDLMAQLQTLRADLLATSSATEVLGAWCAAHDLARPAKIVAQRLPVPPLAPDAAQLRRLDVRGADEVMYRRVELRCGEHVLSKAENWYVPARLTPEMNRLLDTTDTPFGAVVAPLKPFRKTIESAVLWSPPRADADCVTRGARPPITLPAELLRHRVVVYSADLVPFSEVIEVYQDDVLDFAPRICETKR